MSFKYLVPVIITAAVAAIATPASAADVKPALIYDIGGKFDKSFNEGAFHGAEKFKEDTGVDFRDFEIQNDTQREQAMRKFARDGFSPIVAVGFSQASARSAAVSLATSPASIMAWAASAVSHTGETQGWQ